MLEFISTLRCLPAIRDVFVVEIQRRPLGIHLFIRILVLWSDFAEKNKMENDFSAGCDAIPQVQSMKYVLGINIYNEWNSYV